MPPASPPNFSAVLRAIERALGIQYPPMAAAFLGELSKIIHSPHYDSPLKNGRLLLDADEIAALQGETGDPLFDGYLLPFLLDGDGPQDLYGYDLKGPSRQRIVVYSVHTLVRGWPNSEAFLQWAAGLTH